LVCNPRFIVFLDLVVTLEQLDKTRRPTSTGVFDVWRGGRTTCGYERRPAGKMILRLGLDSHRFIGTRIIAPLQSNRFQFYIDRGRETFSHMHGPIPVRDLGTLFLAMRIAPRAIARRGSFLLHDSEIPFTIDPVARPVIIEQVEMPVAIVIRGSRRVQGDIVAQPASLELRR
jgi:hypothetical protein